MHLYLCIEDLNNFVKLPHILYEEGIAPEKVAVYHFDFVNVSFRYPGVKEYALKDINLHFSTDQKISLVGLNGAGKTTFVKLLLRLYDVTEGEILLNGVNIKRYSYTEYRRLLLPYFRAINCLPTACRKILYCPKGSQRKRNLQKSWKGAG